MTPPQPRPTALLVAVSLVAALAVPHALISELGVPTKTQPSPIELRLPPWESLDFEATKLFITARCSISATKEAVTKAQTQWVQGEFDSHRPPQSSPTTLRISSGTELLGRFSDTTVWLDPQSMAAYQSTLTEHGRRMRHKTYQFAANQVLELRSEPATQRERKFEEPRWSKRSERRIEVPDRNARSVPTVTDPLAIFYAIASLPPELLDAGYEMDVLTRNRVRRVRIVRLSATGQTRTRAVLTRSDGSLLQNDSPRLVPTAHYKVTPLGSDGDLKLLGLQGAIEVVVDEALRMPLQIRGRIPPVGKITVRLVAAKLWQ